MCQGGGSGGQRAIGTATDSKAGGRRRPLSSDGHAQEPALSPLRTWHPQTLQGFWPLSPLRQEQLPWRSHPAIPRVEAQEDPAVCSPHRAGEACGAMHREEHGAR